MTTETAPAQTTGTTTMGTGAPLTATTEPATSSTTTTEPLEPKGSLLSGEEPKAPEAAPEKYADFTLPEGLELAPEALTEAIETFKKLNLSQASAQQLVDFHVKAVQATQKSMTDFWNAKQDEWVKQAKADPEIGGAKFNNVLSSINKMLGSLGDAKLVTDFKDAMTYTGAGNNPVVLRTLWALAQQLTEGTHVPAGGPARTGQTMNGASRPSPAEALYGNTKS